MRNLIIWAVVVGAIAFFGTKWYMHKRVGEGVDMMVLMMSPWAQVEYDGISSTLSGELTIDGVSAYITGFSDELQIGRIGIDTPSFLTLMELSDIGTGMVKVPEVPEYFGFIAKDVRYPVDADYFKKLYKLMLESAGVGDKARDPAARCVGKYGFSSEALEGLGYDEQVFSMSIILRQQEQSYAMEMSLEVEDMWTMDAVMTLAGDMTAEFMKGTAYRPKLREMRVEFEDDSLIKRVNKYCDRLGLTPEQTLVAQMDKLDYMGRENGIIFDEYMTEPYKKFLDEKGKLIVTAKPNEPISVTHIDLYAPADVPALLNLEASVQ